MAGELHFVTSKIVDSSTGQPLDHVTSLNERRKTAGIVGPGTYLLPVRDMMECSMVDSNTLRIMGGDAITCGGHWEVKGDYCDLTIDNGTPGMKRIDVAVARLASAPGEDIVPVVIKGEESATNPVTPGHVVGDLNDGDTVTEVPICSVLIDGINPQEPVNLIQQHLLMPLNEVKEYIDTELGKLRDSVSQQITGKWVARPGEISLVDWSLTTKGAQPYIQISVFTPDDKRYIGTLNMSAFS